MNGLCVINENEIVIYCIKKGKVYGYNYWIIFYDLKEDKKEYIKLGNFDVLDLKNKIKSFCLLNENYLLGGGNERFFLFNIHKRSIEKKIDNDCYYINYMISLNNNSFLVVSDTKIIQYEIDKYNNIKVIAKDEYIIPYRCVRKFPGNRLIMQNCEKITIFGY